MLLKLYLPDPFSQELAGGHRPVLFDALGRLGYVSRNVLRHFVVAYMPDHVPYSLGLDIPFFLLNVVLNEVDTLDKQTSASEV